MTKDDPKTTDLGALPCAPPEVRECITRDLRGLGIPLCDRAADEIERLRDALQTFLDYDYCIVDDFTGEFQWVWDKAKEVIS